MEGRDGQKSSRLAADLERRAHFRLECDLTAEFDAPEAEASGEATVSSIGFGGARADLPVDLPIPCALTLKIRTLGPPLEIECEVAWTTTMNDSAPYPTGLKFAGLSDKLKARLFEILIDLMEG